MRPIGVGQVWGQVVKGEQGSGLGGMGSQGRHPGCVGGALVTIVRAGGSPGQVRRVLQGRVGPAQLIRRR